MARLNLATLGRIVPEWGQPFARRALSSVRVNFERFGLTAALERGYRRRLITHAQSRAAPRIRASFAPERRPLDADVEAASRVLNAWHRGLERHPVVSSDSADALWGGLARHHHGELFSLLGKKNPLGLAEYLCNMPRHGATHGIIQGEAEFRKASASRRFQDWSALFILDRLVSLAEIVGVLRMENPEQGRWGENLYEAPDELVAKLENALGIGITVPPVEGCLFTLETKSGRLHFRDITALYAAWRIRAITNHLEGAAICEIGGGVGRVAYYCSKFGIGNFAIFDLPLVNVLQGYFLIRALPGANVVLYGEDMPADGRAIRVLPGWAFQEVPSKTFDLVLNQDSFPEIERSTVRQYLREIARTTRSHFLSINHEAESPIGASAARTLVVGDVVQEVGGFERLYRFPCWVRAGYVEELYRCTP